ncbi:TRAP transporter small permease subunit [Oceanobacillus piezotolerans]|uniref:TRAP transporter small permease subunit n=1 Tax=Oceanobacillus piezotolerans TaxID=2448030 RepID=A0A498DFX8_9BACI|nr:TRAP transporter small permease subunit [Oceanobacillus piezotolerans]RLL46851.1 TRAP transporter small permease subunit [Oceanobacillus piezotolerans]
MKILNKIDTVMLIISGITVLIMMLLIVLEVMFRTFLNISIPGNYEFTQNYLMPLAVFPILSQSYTSGILPKVNLFIDRIKNLEIKRLIQLSLLIVEIITFLIVTYFAFGYALKGVAAGVSFTAGGTLFPLYHVLFIVPFGFLLMSVKGCFLLVNMLRDKKYIPFS